MASQEASRNQDDSYRSENESESDDNSSAYETDDAKSNDREQKLDKTANDESVRARHLDILTNLMSDLNKEELRDNEDAQKQFFKDYKDYICPAPAWVRDVRAIHSRNVPFKLAIDGHIAPKLRFLLRLLVQQYPELLEDRDTGGRGALDYAIEMKLEWFIVAVLDSEIPEKNWQIVLTPKKTRGEQGSARPNCIHTAITIGLKPSLTVRLIEKASGDMLAAQDDNGLTPLHHAVEYSRCTKERRKIVRALLEHGDGALDKRTGTDAALSVYRYHIATRKQHDEKNTLKLLQESRVERNDRNSKSEKRNERAIPGADRKPAKQEEQADKEKEPKAKSEKEQKERKQNEQKMRQGALRRRSTASNDGALDVNAQGALIPANQPNEGRQLSDVLPRAPAATSPASHINIKPADRKSKPDNVAGEIAKLLKLHYFRTIFSNKHRAQDASLRDHASAVDFLFGDNHEDKLICFDFPPIPRKKQVPMDFDRFKESYKLFNFDPALLYVDFRKLELQVSDNPRAAEGMQDSGAGRRDMVQFFDWLYTDKRVRDIIKVTVEDREGVPHCDEVIIDSLKRFSIEILDWRKLDLCPFAIQRASAKSNKMRELHLWWSGSNAVLRAWSERQGLALLPSLEKIHIYEAKRPLESAKRAKDDFDAFITRLNNARKTLDERDEALLDVVRKSSTKSDVEMLQDIRESLKQQDVAFKEITVKVHSFDDSYSQGPNSPSIHRQGSTLIPGGERINIHEWLDIMDTFAGAIRRLQERKPSDYLTRLALPDELKEPVTVALIDDGVDFMHPAISEKLLPGRSFDSGFGARHKIGAPEPYHGSTTGHGTIMAYSIQRVCPDVRVFPYKIDVLKKANGPATFTAKSAADAVEDAVKRGFDIISMSWTVQYSDSKHRDNSTDLNRLKQALQNATKSDKGKMGKEILLFCSAPDFGQSNSKNRYFPFDCTDLPKMFRIGAAKADGSPYSPVDNHIDFLLPGEKIIMKESDMVIPEEDTNPRTGSSLATAHAAGLAAMILHCVRMGAVHNYYEGTRTGVTEASLRAIKTHDAMKAAFQTIRNPDTTSFTSPTDRRLGVETFFKGPGQALGKDSNLTDEEKWIRVAQIARNLVSDNTENTQRP